MTKEQEVLRDVNCEIDDKEDYRKKIISLLENHRSKDLKSISIEDSEKLRAEVDNADKQLRQIDIDLIALKAKRDGINSALKLKENKNIMDIVEEKNLSKKERAMYAGLGAVKILIAHYSRGKIIHKLNENELRETLRYNNLESIKRFTGNLELRDIAARYPYEAAGTTSEVLVPATDVIMGQSNLGLAIPVQTLFDLLEIDGYESTFFRDVRKTNFAGHSSMLIYVGGTGADWIPEGECTPDELNEFDKFEIFANSLSKYFKITFEMMALAPEEILRFMLEEIRSAMDEAINFGAIYGQGKDYIVTINGLTKSRPQPRGVTLQSTLPAEQAKDAATKILIGSTVGTGTNAIPFITPQDIIENAPSYLRSINRRALRGAKFYVSVEFYKKLWNSKNPTTGERLFAFNDIITNIGGYPIVQDEILEGMDVIFGNARNYVWNTASNIELMSDLQLKCRSNEWGAFGMFDGKGRAKHFLYFSDSTTPRDYLAPSTVEFRKKVGYQGKTATA
jgi:HK97 family phage major capsid protein